MPGQRASAHISARCAMVLPFTVTAAPILGGGSSGGGAWRARSSMRSLAMRMAKMGGSAAVRKIAICDNGLQRAGGDFGPEKP